ncbi:hypothetical protein [Actinomadura rubrisoli]|uniref:Phage tail tape measure protein domain-containing protein n=1 Tax=Actinomadura rubrisoli TaxID=2530368 RepID=A0A4R5BUJ8_9ACTN|nr:hypothetical protein [Actinomadura rubrisoli]TDD90771.1 hypothetical protein E1298_12785 [Actinomadura rubrisoli]
MALDLGELVGRISLDDRGFTGTIRTAEQGMNRLESSTRSSLTRQEQAFQQAGNANAQTVTRAMDRMESEAARGGREAGQAAARGMGQGLDRVETEARQAGQDAGEEMGDGAERESKSRFGGLGGKLAGMLGKAGPFLAAGAAVGGVFMVGLAGAMEKQDATAKLNAQVGAFGPEAKRLGKIAGALYNSGYGAEMGQVTEAVGAVITSIDGMRNANSNAVRSMTAKAMDLADVFEIEVGRSMQVVGQLVRTGLVKDANQGMDLLTVALQRVPAAVREDLVDALDEYGPFMDQIGIKGQRAFNVLVTAAGKGAFGLDKTGDAFKELTLKIASSDKAVDDSLKSIGLSQAKVQGAFAKGGKAGTQAFQSIVSGLLKIKDPAKLAESAIVLFGTPMEDLNVKDIPAFLRSLAKTGDVLGKTGGAADRMGKTLHDTASQNLTTFQRSVKSKLVDFLGGKVVPGLTSFGGKANTFFQKWVGDNQSTVEKAKGIWSKVGNTVGSAVGGTKKWLDENRDTVKKWSTGIGDAVGTAAGIVDGALDIVGVIGRIFGPTTLQVIGLFISTLIGWWSGVFKILKGVFDVFAGIFTGDWQRVWSGLKSIVAGNMKLIGVVFRAAGGLFGAIWGLIWRGIKALAQRTWSALVSAIKSQVSVLISGVGRLSSLPGRVAAWFGRMKDAAVGKALALAAWMRGLPPRLLSGLGNLGRLLYGAGRDLLSGLWSGIQSMAGSIKSRIGGLIDSIIPGPVKKVLGIASPSKVMRKIGRQIMQGLHGGLTSSDAGKVAATTKRTASLIAKAFKGKNTRVDDRLLASLKKSNTKLQGLAKERAKLLAKVAEAKEYGKTIASNAATFGAITSVDLGEGGGFGAAITGMRDRLAQLKTFAGNIAKLSKAGLSKTVLRQILDAGPEQAGALAAALAAGGKSAVDQVNTVQADLDKVSKGLGDTAADSLYDAGRKAASGFLAGLKGQEKALAAQMKRMAAAITRAIKRALKIKSPSQVMAGIGGNVGDGLVLGMAKTIPDLARVTAQMSTTAQQIRTPARAAVAAPSVDLSAARAQGARIGGDGCSAALHVEHYHEAERGSARGTAEELLMLTKARG